jgi:CBS domain-containing protein
MLHLSLEQILERIGTSITAEQMRSLRDLIHERWTQERLLFYYPEVYHESVNAFHDALISRTVAIAESQMIERGKGKPPTSYAFILYGSGGRREQTLWSDQDNGFVYEQSNEISNEKLDTYYEEFVSLILQGLSTLGYPPCEGDVVSSNSRWRKSIKDYRVMIEGWLQDPTWENVRYLLIMADIRCIYGNQGLVDTIRDDMTTYIRTHSAILNNMLTNTLHHKVTLGLFGQLITERYGEDAGGFDIKYGAYIPFVNGIRLLAIKAGIHASGTLERIRLLTTQEEIDDDLGEEWLHVFESLLKFRSMTPSLMEESNYTTRGKLREEHLSQKETRMELKMCLRVGIDLQRYVKKNVEAAIEKA